MYRRHFLMKSAAAAGLALGSVRRSSAQNVSPVFATASELALWIQTGMISAADVLEAHLKHIAQYNPPLNAIVTLDADRARVRAREADAAVARGERWGLLHGVPVTVKDALETAGLRTTSGFPPLSNNVPQTDAPVVAKLKAAGAILLGKTNLPTLASDYRTTNPIFGRTNNPWNLARTPGGSSGGEAAALAAGLSPLGFGSDIAGSLRQPAHFCGTYSLKPTEHRVSVLGHIPPVPGTPFVNRHLLALGPMARSVSDLTLGLRAIAGPDGRQWEVSPAALNPAPERNLAELRFVVSDDFGVPVTADTRAAIAELARNLEQGGAQVSRALPAEFDIITALETWGELFMAEVGAALTPEEQRQFAGGASESSPDPTDRGIARAVNATVRFYNGSLIKRDRLISILEQMFASTDALICPVGCVPAFPHTQTGPFTVGDKTVGYNAAFATYSCPFTVTGHPVVTVPVARSAEGLPIGAQIVGRHWGEMDLLVVAARVAEVIGPFRRPPGY